MDNPRHIAIIMDGNGRWAKKRGLPRIAGHKEGAITAEKIIDACVDLNIEVVSLYAFSTENWKRSVGEIENIFSLIDWYILNKSKKLIDGNVRFHVMGDISKFSEKRRQSIRELEERSKKNTGLILNIAINYGARDEIVMAVGELLKENLTEITYEDISRHLYTKNMPDVDLLIRPSGEQRLSNFLLLQSAYAELWFSDILWPDFSKEDLLSAIKSYHKRDRRFGGTDE